MNRLYYLTDASGFVCGLICESSAENAVASYNEAMGVKEATGCIEILPHPPEVIDVDPAIIESMEKRFAEPKQAFKPKECTECTAEYYCFACER